MARPAWKWLLREPVDLILLDLMLPGQNGLIVCEKLRKAGSTTPILMLTARRQTKDKVAGLKAGGDDYLTKPFQMSELLARVEALLRRAATSPDSGAGSTNSGPSRSTRGARRSRATGTSCRCPPRNFSCFDILWSIRTPHSPAKSCCAKCGATENRPSTRTVDVHVAWLRQKLEPDPKNPQFILTVVGFGYKFVG